MAIILYIILYIDMEPCAFACRLSAAPSLLMHAMEYPHHPGAYTTSLETLYLC